MPFGIINWHCSQGWQNIFLLDVHPAQKNCMSNLTLILPTPMCPDNADECTLTEAWCLNGVGSTNCSIALLPFINSLIRCFNHKWPFRFLWHSFWFFFYCMAALLKWLIFMLVWWKCIMYFCTTWNNEMLNFRHSVCVICTDNLGWISSDVWGLLVSRMARSFSLLL